MTDLIKRWRELAATVEHDYGTVAPLQSNQIAKTLRDCAADLQNYVDKSKEKLPEPNPNQAR